MACGLVIILVILVDNVVHPEKRFKPPMIELPAFLATVYKAEQLTPLLKAKDQYFLLRMEGLPPGQPAPLVRIGSFRWTAQRIDPTEIKLPSGEGLLVN